MLPNHPKTGVCSHPLLCTLLTPTCRRGVGGRGGSVVPGYRSMCIELLTWCINNTRLPNDMHAGVVLEGEVVVEAEGGAPAELGAGTYSGAVKVGEKVAVPA